MKEFWWVLSSQVWYRRFFFPDDLGLVWFASFQFGTDKFGLHWQSFVGVDEIGLVNMSLVWCASVWFVM